MRFQSTPPLREATFHNYNKNFCHHNFNPRLPCGRRRTNGSSARWCSSNFNPRLPCGRRPRKGANDNNNIAFQSTPPLREATFHTYFTLTVYFYFNPRLPCGRRLMRAAGQNRLRQFQSTPPLREATSLICISPRHTPISIHASLAGGDTYSACHSRPRFCHFNPRLPCGRRHSPASAICPFIKYFNPRLPCGRRHKTNVLIVGQGQISIHASLAGGDICALD